MFVCDISLMARIWFSRFSFENVYCPFAPLITRVIYVILSVRLLSISKKDMNRQFLKILVPKS